MNKLLQRLKTWVFRLYYRHINYKAWSAHPQGVDLPVSNLIITLESREIATRMYHGEQDKPLIVYYHGGGWVIGDLNTHDPFCRALASASGCTIMSVDYRLAPEHPFPAAHDDCLDTTRWILDRLNTLAPNNGTVVIAGDSAGGNLTVCTAATLHGEPRIVGTIVLYPATEHYLAGLPSYTEHAKTGPLTTAIMHWFFDTSLCGVAPADPKAKTLFINRRCDYTQFPRTLLVTAERDPLRDDGKRLSIAMQQAQVELTFHHYADEAHGFACSEGPTPGHQHFIALAVEWLAPLCSSQQPESQ